MRYILFSAVLIASAATPAHANVGANSAFNAAFVAMGARGKVLEQNMSAVSPKKSTTLKPYVVMQFDDDLMAPSTLDRTSADRQASAYCQTASYQLGRALRVTPVTGTAGRFAYFRVDRLICFNDDATSGA